VVNTTTPIEIDFLPVSHCYPRKRTEPWRSMLTDAQGSPRTIMEVRESPTNPKLISTSSPKKSARSFKSWRKPHERSFHPVHRLYRLFMPASAVSETKYKPLQHQRAFQYLLWGLVSNVPFTHHKTAMKAAAARFLPQRSGNVLPIVATVHSPPSIPPAPQTSLEPPRELLKLPMGHAIPMAADARRARLVLFVPAERYILPPNHGDLYKFCERNSPPQGSRQVSGSSETAYGRSEGTRSPECCFWW